MTGNLYEKQNESVYKMGVIKFAYIIREWVAEEKVGDCVSIYVYSLPDRGKNVAEIKRSCVYKGMEMYTSNS